MAKSIALNSFSDILTPRRNEFSNFSWVSRKLDTVLAFKQSQKQTPAGHKKEVASSQPIQKLIEKVIINACYKINIIIDLDSSKLCNN